MSNALRPQSVAALAPDSRRWTRLVLVLFTVVAMIVVLATPSVAFAADAGTQLRYACAQKSNGLLRAASSANDCRPKQETSVTIWPGPTLLCIQPDGSVRRFTAAKSCTGVKPSGTVLVVPTTNGQPVHFCAPSSGVLRRVSATTACLSTEQRYVIGNHAPSALTLSNGSLLENEPAGTVVGTLGLVDEDPAATPTFALVSGTGSGDNAAFTITGSTLKTASSFDYETKTSYSIRVRGSDGYGGSLEQVFTIAVLDVVEDVPPTAVGDEATVDEDAAATTVDVLVNDEDLDGGPISISDVSQPAHGTVVIAGDEASVTYEPDPGFCNDPPGTTTDEFTYTLAPGGSTTTVGMTVTCVDDLPVAADDEATVDEDAAATAIDVLANDADGDGGPGAITSVVQPEHGTVVITGGGTGLTYQPDAEYCNAPPGDANDLFSYTLSPGDANAQVSVTVICIADAPVADDETFDGASAAVGNTAYVIDDPTDGPPAVDGPHLVVAGDLLDGDTDGDPGTELAIEPGIFASDAGGLVTIEADGDVVYQPPAGCAADSDGFDYTVTDQGPVAPLTGTGHVTVAISGCVWYVSNAAAGNGGTSWTPFDTTAQADAASVAGDDLFVFEGDGTTTGYATAMRLDDDQQLIGEASDLVVDGRTLHDGDPTARPTLTADALFVVGLGVGNVVSGLEVRPGAPGGGIGAFDHVNDPAGDVRVDDVHIIDTVLSGFGAALALQYLTGTNEVSDLVVDVVGVGVLVTDTETITFDPASTVAVRAAGAGYSLLVQRSGLDGSQFDTVVADDTTFGGIYLQDMTGAVAFDDLDLRVVDSSQPAFRLISTDPVTVPASGTATLHATGGPALAIGGSSGSSLSFDSVTSTGSPTYGAYIQEFGTGTFAAAGGELSSSTLAAFRVIGGSGDVSYGGAIGDGAALINVDISGRTGGTVALSGAITDGPDAGGGIVVAGSTGGSTVISGATKQLETGEYPGVRFSGSDGHALSITGGGLAVTTAGSSPLVATASGSIAVTGSGNTLDSATGTGLTITDTDIAAAGVTVERVSVDGAASGIVLTNTGTAGGLHVTGLGSTAQGGDASGGTIAATTGNGISLTNTADASFRNVRVEASGGSGVAGTGVAGFSFTNGTITGAGDAATEDGLAFDAAGVVNLTGAVDISGNVLEQNEASGISITNTGGTISSATISGNRISDAGDLLTPGSALLLQATGTAGGAATITKATMSSNVITDFRAGYGIRIVGGNQAGNSKSTLGIPGNAVNVVAVTGNRMDGGSGGLEQQPDSFVDMQVFGAADANIDVSTNGTGAEPLRHFDCTAISVMTGGVANVAARIENNTIAAGSSPGCAGIAAIATSLNDVGATLTARVANNNVRATGGPGIVVEASSSGAATAKIMNNVVQAPTGGLYGGIVADSGSAGIADARLCVALTGNTTAGGSGVGLTAPGIQLSKLSSDPATNDFGIEGLPPGQTSSPSVENYLNALNTSTPGTIGVGGTVLSSATSGFTSCATGL